MATKLIWTPGAAEYPSANFAPLGQDTTIKRLYNAFDPTTAEHVWLTGVVPQGGFTGAVSAVLLCKMASAITGNVVCNAYVEAVTPADALDLDAAESFDAANGSGAVAVPGTAGYLFTVSITLTNNDAWAAGDLIRIKIERDAANGSDTATGDLHVLSYELRDAA